jgi:ABC-2 type transport system ATP-binding protein
MTVFMSTHTLAMAEEMADRLGIMVRGRLRFLGTVPELREQMALETTSLEQLYLRITEPATDDVATRAESRDAR